MTTNSAKVPAALADKVIMSNNDTYRKEPANNPYVFKNALSLEANPPIGQNPQLVDYDGEFDNLAEVARGHADQIKLHYLFPRRDHGGVQAGLGEEFVSVEIDNTDLRAGMAYVADKLTNNEEGFRYTSEGVRNEHGEQVWLMEGWSSFLNLVTEVLLERGTLDQRPQFVAFAILVAAFGADNAECYTRGTVV
jgi:hypothetical protein